MQDGMFYRLGDFAFARNAKQAVGFYLFHLLLGCAGFVLAVLVYKLVFGLPEGAESMYFMARVSTALSMLYVGYLSYRLLEAKGLLSAPRYLVYAALGLAVSAFGMLLGLVGVACLSIFRPADAQAAVHNEEEQP